MDESSSDSSMWAKEPFRGQATPRPGNGVANGSPSADVRIARNPDAGAPALGVLEPQDPSICKFLQPPARSDPQPTWRKTSPHQRFSQGSMEPQHPARSPGSSWVTSGLPTLAPSRGGDAVGGIWGHGKPWMPGSSLLPVPPSRRPPGEGRHREGHGWEQSGRSDLRPSVEPAELGRPSLLS